MTVLAIAFIWVVASWVLFILLEVTNSHLIAHRPEGETIIPKDLNDSNFGALEEGEGVLWSKCCPYLLDTQVAPGHTADSLAGTGSQGIAYTHKINRQQ